MDQNTTPLYDALRKYALEENVISFDVPGHKKCAYDGDYSNDLSKNIFKFDANSMKCLDILSNPNTVIKHAEKLYANYYHADHAYFLVNGSTSGVQYMIMSICKPNDKIILPRNIHKSAYNALILSGAVPIYIEPEFNDEFNIYSNVTYENVKKVIHENSDAKALLLLHPTYFGVTSDLKKIIKLAHDHNICVLVDEAHGALFASSKNLPDNATSIGADMSTISVHKTAGSFTQSSVLLSNDKLVTNSILRSTINLMQTTSASYLLMSSLDVSRKWLFNNEQHISKLINLSNNFKRKVNDLPGLKCLDIDNINTEFNLDPLKLVINVDGLNLTGFKVYDILRDDYNIQMELAENSVILGIIGIGDNKESINSLYLALEDLSNKYYKKTYLNTIKYTEKVNHSKQVYTPREAFYMNKVVIKLKDAQDKIAGESLMIYPPGIPLVLMGEIISKEVIDYYYFLQTQDTVLVGVEEGNAEVYIKVIKE